MTSLSYSYKNSLTSVAFLSLSNFLISSSLHRSDKDLFSSGIVRTMSLIDSNLSKTFFKVPQLASYIISVPLASFQFMEPCILSRLNVGISEELTKRGLNLESTFEKTSSLKIGLFRPLKPSLNSTSALAIASSLNRSILVVKILIFFPIRVLARDAKIEFHIV